MNDLPDINLWLDDDKTSRRPPICGINWTWAYTADEAIRILDTGRVVWASLDHDLADEHYFYYHSKLRLCHEAKAHKKDFFEASGLASCPSCGIGPDDENWAYNNFTEKTGMSVLDHIEEHSILPRHGIRIHTMNPGKKIRMLNVVNKLYGRTFQVQYQGTHSV